MKKNIKVMVLIYIGVAIVSYGLSVRMNRLSNIEETKNQNKSIVLKLR